jgi:hypothetical protein
MVVHNFDRKRAGQHRGLSVLNPILARLKMLTKYDGAELQQAILQTVFGTFITSPFDQGQVSNALQDPDDPEISAYSGAPGRLSPGKGPHLGRCAVAHHGAGRGHQDSVGVAPGRQFQRFRARHAAERRRVARLVRGPGLAGLVAHQLFVGAGRIARCMEDARPPAGGFLHRLRDAGLAPGWR